MDFNLMPPEYRDEAKRNMEHANDYELVTDFVINDGKKHPFALVIPGGGYWCVCSYVEGTPFARELNNQGISVFILFYHVKDKAKFPAPQEDAARAVKEILDNADKYNVETKGNSVWGSSAGGHLAASFGTTNMGYAKYGLPKPGSVVLIYPVVTMRDFTHQGSRDMLLGTDPAEKMIKETSVELHADKDYPPTFIWYGEADDVVPPRNSIELKKALDKAGVPSELHSYPEVGHGAGLAVSTPAEGWFTDAVNFIKRFYS